MVCLSCSSLLRPSPRAQRVAGGLASFPFFRAPGDTYAHAGGPTSSVLELFAPALSSAGSPADLEGELQGPSSSSYAAATGQPVITHPAHPPSHLPQGGQCLPLDGKAVLQNPASDETDSAFSVKCGEGN